MPTNLFTVLLSDIIVNLRCGKTVKAACMNKSSHLGEDSRDYETIST